MSSIGERIRQVRKEESLSMDAFGKRIAVSSAAVARWETGENNPAERTIKLICNEFHINYAWLTQGTGPMRMQIESSILDDLVNEYHLSDQDRKILEMYLMLTDEQRAGIHAFVNGMIEADKRQSK